MCAVARQLTNCHRQLPAIRFILERPRSVYVVRRGMINQRRVASRSPARSLVASISLTIGELGRNIAVRTVRAWSRSVSLNAGLFLPFPQVVYRCGINVHFLRSRAWKIPRPVRRAPDSAAFLTISFLRFAALIRSMRTEAKMRGTLFATPRRTD